MRPFRALILVTVAGLVAPGVKLQAQEKSIPPGELPKAVLDAVKNRFPSSELLEAAKEVEGGKTGYEATVKVDGKKIDVMVTPEGAITLIEKEIAKAELPEAVKAALEKNFPKATYKVIEEVSKVKNGKESVDFYEAQLETADAKKVEAKVAADGTIQGKEETNEKEEVGAPQAGRWTSEFAVEKDELVATGRNPFFVLEPGYQLVLENANTRLTITVLNETKTIDGVECRIVEEKEVTGDKVKERSKNYFAISKRTNSVFYFGEDVGGAWQSGEKGARFGLMMPGLPLVGARFQEEVAPGVAMDRARIVGLAETVRVPAGEFKNCLKIEETTPLEPNEKEHKLYARGVGLVHEGDLKLVKYGTVELPTN
jgi:hypothetical protein